MTGWALGRIGADTNTDKIFLSLRQAYKQLLIADVFESDDGVETEAFRGRNYSEIFARCLTMGAFIETDKMAIALNISKLGLFFDATSLSLDDCIYAYSLLALATSDITCLCNQSPHLEAEIVSKSLFLLHNESARAHSWLQRPLPNSVYNQLPVPHLRKQDENALEACFLGLRCNMTFFSGDW
jgi:hypothetical protein